MNTKKGYKLSKKTVERMKKNRVGMLGKHHTKKSKLKISDKLKDLRIKPPSRKGEKPWNKGKPFMSMEKHPNWQGGKSFELYSVDWTETLRRSIRERDNYICQLCSQYGSSVHHKDYDKKNCNPDNLITLCKRCNTKVNKNRNYWMKRFKKI